jgi:putative phosphoribosyl transferase
MPWSFLNRMEAGRELAKLLKAYANRQDVLVLGIPRGGVTVAFQVAAELHAPLDVFIVRKLGVPGREELAFGAIASGGFRFLDREIVEAHRIPNSEIERITAMQAKELNRRERIYRGGRPPLVVAGRTVILVDDGIATGSSVQVAITALHHMKPARLVVAAPVAAADPDARLKHEVDEFICIRRPVSFYGIGEFYEDFSQVSDEEVKDLLRRNTGKPAKDAA